ncbi:MAG: hypothetical protein GEV06_21945 [Luteitalea sp.]|nr:hypothetical protein [Luteitalea sp.]
MTNHADRTLAAGFTLVLVGFGALFLQAASNAAGPVEAPTIVMVTDTSPGTPVRHGLEAIRSALDRHGITLRLSQRMDGAQGESVIVAGLSSGSGAAARLVTDLDIDAPVEAEALLIRHVDQPRLLVTAPDDRGLMYALLDVAERIGWADDPARPLSEVRDAREAPAVVERALSVYTMHRAWFESRFFDRTHWERYFDLLAKNRFNSFVLIFGYENAGYLAPAYPYFFDVEEFPNVRVVEFTADDQRRYVDALRELIAAAHARGLDVTVGLWDHIYRGGVQAGGMDVEAGERLPGVVTGLTQDNLMAYSQAALAKFLQTFPGIDAVQFRMHGESGLKPEEMHDFWKGIYAVMKQHAPEMRFDARAKDFPDSLIDLAVEMGVNIRISTKYWAEQMGLPFHPTHINQENQHDRRHGYADLLRYPKKYDMHWRLWNGGTTRVLLWGDPEYVRRFAASSRLYDGQGYEVNEMLATKMASQPHDLTPFELLSPAARGYDYEFERYWHFFQVFGRIGYNPDTPSDVWTREFERRLGRAAAPHIERALHRASWILPMITAYNFPYNRFPTTRGWPEKQRREDLREYAAAEPSDTEQFLSMADAARLTLAQGESAAVWPQESSRWFAEVAEAVLRDVREAERQAATPPRPELESTIVDLRILAGLAQYHSHRALAGLSWALWEQSRDVNALDEAIAEEGRAIQAWEQIVEAAGDVYNDNLRMGLATSGLTGHWRNELDAAKQGLTALEEERQTYRPATHGSAPAIAHVPARRIRPGEPLGIRATVTGPRPIARVRVSYQAGDRFGDVPLEPAGPYTYRGKIPAERVSGPFSYIIHATDDGGRATTWPASDGRAAASAVLATADDEPPVVHHTPVARARAARPLRVEAEVTDPSGVKWVRLRYRSVNQHQDYRTLEMRADGEGNRFSTVVPAAEVVPTWDFMYFIEVMDRAGNGKIYPDLYTEQPYVVVPLERGGQKETLP